MGLKGLALTLLFLTITSFRCLFVEVTTFDLSYKVYKKEIKYDIEPNVNLLYCENELGKFKIDVSTETYRNHKVNDYIRYNEPFTSYEMYRYAVDEKTEEKVVNAVNGIEKTLLKYTILQIVACFMSFGGIIFLSPVLAQIITKS